MGMIDKVLTWQIEKMGLFAAPLIVTEAILLSILFGILVMHLPIWLRIVVLAVLPILVILLIKKIKGVV